MIDIRVSSVAAGLLDEASSDRAGRDPAGPLRFVRGLRMPDLGAAFDEFAAALQFPWYFGRNLDAFSDCMSDLSWLGCRVDLVVRDAEAMLPEFSDAIRFHRVLRDAADGSRLPAGLPGIALRLALNVPPERVDAMRAFVREAYGVDAGS